MKKSEQIKNAISQERMSVRQIAEKTGLKANEISAFLAASGKSWGVERTGVRGSYQYAIGAASGGAEAGEAVAEQNAPA